MPRRLLFTLTLSLTLVLSGCSGMNLDYYLGRLAFKFNLPALDPRKPEPGVILTITPVPTLPSQWVELSTQTPTPTIITPTLTPRATTTIPAP